jgi:hypothetical protein
LSDADAVNERDVNTHEEGDGSREWGGRLCQ